MWTVNTSSFCENVKVKFPIIQAPMAGGPTTPSLISTVSNAGGIGSLGAGYMDPDKLRTTIRDIKSKTDYPFSVNVFIPPIGQLNKNIDPKAKSLLNKFAEHVGITIDDFEPEVKNVLDKQIKILIEEQVPIVSFTFGVLPEKYIKALKQNGSTIIGTATSSAEAIELEKKGCDMLVAQGFEAGGHRGSFLHGDNAPLIGLFSLIQTMCNKVNVPVIASGGIVDGKGIAASLILGASAVQMGTAFLATDESGAADIWKEKLIQAQDSDSVLTKAFSGKFARGVKNEFIDVIDPYVDSMPSYPILNSITKKIRSLATSQKDTSKMSLWAGQSSSLARRLSAEELLKILVAETNKALNKTPDFYK
jgi:nitronate monooxygenase